MALLYNPTITTAATTTSGTFKLQEMSGSLAGFSALAVFNYGSGGTTANVYLQTSFDQTVWNDVISFTQFTTSSGKSAGAVSKAASQATTSASGDGTLAAGTIVPGLLGTWWRVKVITTGTYATNTNVAVYASGMIAGL